jgi:hypothetical protein
MTDRAESKINWKPIWWTTIIVTLTWTIIGGIARIAERRLNSDAYFNVQTFFKSTQPDYYPLLYLLIVCLVTFSVVWVYRWILPYLPAHWIFRGLAVGLFLFLVDDLTDAFASIYTTVLTSSAVRGMTIAALLNKLLNGCILTYTYARFSMEKKVDK